MNKKLVPAKNVRAAAYYVTEHLQAYINDIRAAAYPMTAEQYGGPVYEYFLTVLQNTERLLNGDSIEEVIKDIKRNNNDE